MMRDKSQIIYAKFHEKLFKDMEFCHANNIPTKDAIGLLSEYDQLLQLLKMAGEALDKVLIYSDTLCDTDCEGRAHKSDEFKIDLQAGEKALQQLKDAGFCE